MVEAQYLGLMDYQKSIEVMESLAARVERNPQLMFLMGLEYSQTITLGRNAKFESEVLNQNWDAFQTSRGGYATLHNRGQLVVYPLVSLAQLGLGVRSFVSLLTRTTQEVLGDCGIHSKCVSPAGLATEAGKICSIGLQISKSVSRHGLSLNVHNDLSQFSCIRVCGQSVSMMDKVAAHLDSPPSLETLFKDWTQKFLVLGQIDRDS